MDQTKNAQIEQVFCFINLGQADLQNEFLHIILYREISLSTCPLNEDQTDQNPLFYV